MILFAVARLSRPPPLTPPPTGRGTSFFVKQSFLPLRGKDRGRGLSEDAPRNFSTATIFSPLFSKKSGNRFLERGRPGRSSYAAKENQRPTRGSSLDFSSTFDAKKWYKAFSTSYDISSFFCGEWVFQALFLAFGFFFRKICL